MTYGRVVEGQLICTILVTKPLWPEKGATRDAPFFFWGEDSLLTDADPLVILTMGKRCAGRFGIDEQFQCQHEGVHFQNGKWWCGFHAIRSGGWRSWKEPRKKIKASTFGSYAQVKKISACTHEWERVHGILWGYLKVDYQCTKCGTYRRVKEE